MPPRPRCGAPRQSPDGGGRSLPQHGPAAPSVSQRCGTGSARCAPAGVAPCRGSRSALASAGSEIGSPRAAGTCPNWTGRRCAGRSLAHLRRGTRPGSPGRCRPPATMRHSPGQRGSTGHHRRPSETRGRRPARCPVRDTSTAARRPRRTRQERCDRQGSPVLGLARREPREIRLRECAGWVGFGGRRSSEACTPVESRRSVPSRG